jgi:hypothetical protein
MARKDEVVESSRTCIVFRQTAQDTQGALLLFEQFVPPHAPATIYHLHPHQSEGFRVMGVRVNGKETILEPGAEVTVPPPYCTRDVECGRR